MSDQHIEPDHQEEIEIEAIGIETDSHPVELFKMFKLANIVDGGAEAKHIISEGYVAVNGEIETRKRRKMYAGDFFEFNQEYYVLVCDAPATPDTPPQPPKSAKPKSEKRPSTKRSDTEDLSKAKSSDKAKKPKKKIEQGVKNKAAKSRFVKQNNKKDMTGRVKTPEQKKQEKEVTIDKSTGRRSIDFL